MIIDKQKISFDRSEENDKHMHALHILNQRKMDMQEQFVKLTKYVDNITYKMQYGSGDAAVKKMLPKLEAFTEDKVIDEKIYELITPINETGFAPLEQAIFGIYARKLEKILEFQRFIVEYYERSLGTYVSVNKLTVEGTDKEKSNESEVNIK